MFVRLTGTAYWGFGKLVVCSVYFEADVTGVGRMLKHLIEKKLK